MKIIVPKLQMGLSLVEMMVSLAIAMFLMAIALGIYSQEAGLYKTTGTQASVQSAENAISTLVAPVVRSAGFMGCSPLGFGYSVNNLLTAGTSPPLGTLSTSPPAASPSGIFGYDAIYLETNGSTNGGTFRLDSSHETVKIYAGSTALLETL